MTRKVQHVHGSQPYWEALIALLRTVKVAGLDALFVFKSGRLASP